MKTHNKTLGDQSWVFIGRTDVAAETPILWLPVAQSWLTWKDPVAGKDWGQEEKGTMEDEMVGWHYRRNGHGVGGLRGVGDGQGGLACCGSWGCKELDMTERLNWTKSLIFHFKWYTLEKCPNSICSLKVTLVNIFLMSSQEKKVLKHHRCIDDCCSGVSSCGDRQCWPQECWTANAGFGQRSFDA